MTPFFAPSWRATIAIIPLIMGAICLPAAAQTLKQSLPKPVPKQVSPPRGRQKVTVVGTSPVNGGARPGEPVLLASLKGIVFVGNKRQIRHNPVVPERGWSAKDVPILAHTSIGRLAARFLHQPVSEQSLARLRVDISLLLTSLGHPYSLVYLPPQDITNGVVQVVVEESHLGGIRVSGNRYFSRQSYLDRLPLVLNGTIDQRALNRGLKRINDNPFRAAIAEIGKGKKPLTTDVVIVTHEHFPWRFFAGASDTGTRTTGKNRFETGFTWGNVLGLGHQMTLQWTSDFAVDHSRTVSGNYVFDVPSGDTVTLSGAYSRLNAITPVVLKESGVNWQVSADYNHDLPTLKGRRYHQSLDVGVDYKYSNNNLEYALPPFIIPLSGNPTNIVQARLTYTGSLVDDWGRTSGSLTLTGAPGSLGRYNHTADFQRSRAFSEPRYLYGVLNLFRVTALRGPLKGWDWTVHIMLQRSSTNLLSSEQFVLGGSSTVRGYQEGEVIGDDGQLFSQQLVAPGFSLLRLFGAHRAHARDSLRAFVFEDYGQAWSVHALPGERRYTLHSAGLGMRYNLANHLRADLAYGWQLRHSGVGGSHRHGAFNFSLRFSY